MQRRYNPGKKTSETTDTAQLIYSTGESRLVEVREKKIYGSEHFWKLYLARFLKVLDTFKSKEVIVLVHILRNMETSNNTFTGSYRKISKDISREQKKRGERGISLDSVRRTMKVLQDAEFLVKRQNGVYMVSPDILMKGDDNKRAMLKKKFAEAADKKPAPDGQTETEEDA